MMPNTADIAAQAGVRVKQLEWQDKSLPIMLYFSECDDDGKWRYSISGYKAAAPYTLKRYGVNCGEYETIEAAKAAAQADYEARILAAIEPQEVAEPVGEVVNLTGSLNDMAVIQWVSGFQPIPGAKLYASPVTASDAPANVEDEFFYDPRTGRVAGSDPVTASDERAVEAGTALGIARAAANEMLAANTQWRLDPKYILTICDALEAAIAAAPKAQPVQGWQAPEGYALVPVEPTEEMLDAVPVFSRCGRDWREDAKAAFRAMIAAAPLPAGPSSKETAK